MRLSQPDLMPDRLGLMRSGKAAELLAQLRDLRVKPLVKRGASAAASRGHEPDPTAENLFGLQQTNCTKHFGALRWRPQSSSCSTVHSRGGLSSRQRWIFEPWRMR